MNRIRFFAAAVVLPLAAPPALAQETAFDLEPLRVLLAPEAASCAESEGVFDAPDWAFSRHVDFNGDGRTDVVFDGAEMACEPMASFYSGTGGSPRAVFVSTGDAARPWARHDFFGHAHSIVSAPGGSIPVLLVSRHGSACDSFGAAPCVGAYVWGERSDGSQGFLSLVPDPADERSEEGETP